MKKKSLKPDMKVLVLLPTDHNKLLMQYKGPDTVKNKLNRFDYEVDVNGRVKIYHTNLLRRNVERGSDDSNSKIEKVKHIIQKMVEYS